MFNGNVVAGGGIIPASRSLFDSPNRLAAQSINAVDDALLAGDVDDDEDESSLAKHVSAEKTN